MARENTILTDEVITEIRNNIPLRKKIAEYLDVADSSVYAQAKRKAPRLNDYVIVKIIMNQTGKLASEVVKSEALEHVVQ